MPSPHTLCHFPFILIITLNPVIDISLIKDINSHWVIFEKIYCVERVFPLAWLCLSPQRRRSTSLWCMGNYIVMLPVSSWARQMLDNVWVVDDNLNRHSCFSPSECSIEATMNVSFFKACQSSDKCQYIDYKVYNNVTYLFQSFNNCIIQLRTSNLISQSTAYMITYPCWV